MRTFPLVSLALPLSGSLALLSAPLRANRFRRAFALALVLVLVSAGGALGAVTGKIAGTVTDPTGGGIPSVSVKITNTAQGLETKVTADEHGDFIFRVSIFGVPDLYVLPTAAAGNYEYFRVAWVFTEPENNPAVRGWPKLYIISMFGSIEKYDMLTSAFLWSAVFCP